MYVEQTLGRRAALHAALGDPARLAIADALAVADASPSELGRRLDMPSNLLAHHLGVLEAADAITRTRSEADRRRTYVQLTSAALPLVAAGLDLVAARVVFVCTENSARSQLAAALWSRRAHVQVASAGTHPAARVHPRAVAVARRHGIDLRRSRTAHVRDVVRQDDLVVAVCDQAYEELATDGSARLHWSVPDPARSASRDAFDHAFAHLEERVARLAAAIPYQPDERQGEDIARPKSDS